MAEAAIAFLSALLIHELGHLTAAALLGVRLSSFSLTYAGLVFSFDFSRTAYQRELAVHLGGAVLGLASAAAAYYFVPDATEYFVPISVALSIVNLLPISGLDGGGALSCVLSILCLPDRASRAERLVSSVSAILLWAAVLWAELRVEANVGLLLFAVLILTRICREKSSMR